MTPAHVSRLQSKASAMVEKWRCAPHGHKTALAKKKDRAVLAALRAETKAMKRRAV